MSLHHVKLGPLIHGDDNSKNYKMIVIIKTTKNKTKQQQQKTKTKQTKMKREYD